MEFRDRPRPDRQAVQPKSIGDIILGTLFVVALVGVLVFFVMEGRPENANQGPSIDSSSSCEDRYDAVMDSPDVQEHGSGGIAPRDEWIASCEASG